MRKYTSILLSLLLLSSCSSDTASRTPQSDKSMTCLASLHKIAENDGFVHDGLKFSRGGKNDDQLTVSLENSTIIAKDPSSTYGEKADEIMYEFDYTSQEVWDNAGEKIEPDAGLSIYINDWNQIFDKYSSYLIDSGCMDKESKIPTSEELSNRYPKNDNVIESYVDDYDKIKSMMSCYGYECSVKDSEDFVELEDYLDLSVPMGSHLNKDGKMVKTYINNGYATNNLVGFNVIMTKDIYNSRPVTYEDSLNLVSNPLFVQNFIRDIYYKHSKEVGPYIYFAYLDKGTNQKLQAKTQNLDYTAMTYETWKQNADNSMHQFWQDENGNIEYKMYNITDTEIVSWLWNRLKEDSKLKLTDEMFEEYMRIYDYEWQRMMGLREKYYEEFGI